MPKRSFLTVSENLLECAERSEQHYEGKGYRVRREPSKLGYPYSPTLVCQRDLETTLIEVVNEIDAERVSDWVTCCKSTPSDTRFVICMPEDALVDSKMLISLQASRVGLIRVGTNGIFEQLQAADQGVNRSLPELNRLTPKLRSMLGALYEKFDRGDWRDGFQDACYLLEAQARSYLLDGLKSGRITIVEKKKRSLVQQIKRANKATIGGLIAMLEAIRNQNYADTQVLKALQIINKDRVGKVHYKSKKTVETRLRQNACQHVWVIVGALKLLVK